MIVAAAGLPLNELADTSTAPNSLRKKPSTLSHWNGQIRVPQSGVVTVNGSLILDDATVRKVVEFLIELTRELSTLPE